VCPSFASPAMEISGKKQIRKNRVTTKHAIREKILRGFIVSPFPCLSERIGVYLLLGKKDVR
jgi:hypothetical protein